MRLSVQLYTLRDDLAGDLRGTLQGVKEAGLDYVELAGMYGKTAQEWRTMLDDLGLKASGSHVGLDDFENDEAKAIADAKLFGQPFVVVPYSPPATFAQDWPKLKERMKAVAPAIKASGMSLLYHNHDFEIAEGPNGKTFLENLFDGLDPEAVGSELDIAWVKIGGKDPVEFMRTLGPYVKLLHLKDYATTGGERKWVPCGQGEVDFDAVLPLAKEMDVAFGAIELDESKDMPPMEAVRQSVAYFKGKGLS